MQRIAPIAAWILAAYFASGICRSAEAPPAAAFGAVPVESGAVLSGDGRYVAWMDNHETQPRVAVFNLAEKKMQRILAAPEKLKLRSLEWADNTTLLVELSQTSQSTRSIETSDEHFRIFATDVRSDSGKVIPSDPRARGALLVSTHASEAFHVIMATSGPCSDVRVYCLFNVDTRTGKYSVIKAGIDTTAYWVVDRKGRAVAREDWDWLHDAYRVLALKDDGGVKEILRRDDKEHPRLAGLLADGSALVLLATNGLKHQAAWALPLDGSPMEVLAESPNADITNVVRDPYSGAIVGVWLSGSVAHVHWLDPVAKHRSEVLARTFAGRQVEIYGWTEDGTKTLALVQTPSSPPVYYVVDFTSHRADIVAEEYPALANATLGEVKEIKYKARDGTEIPAYLTMPPGKSIGPVPLVVLPHGGPIARDEFSFDWLVQFIATRGYAVLQPQFRGSSGFGDAFQEAGYRQWGGLMQDDVTDGVHAMIDQGVADPRRICIAGASYGGYAALAGAAFTPDLYSCAVSINGVSDLPSLLSETVPQLFGVLSTSMSDWKAHVGGPHDNLAAKSPVNFVKAIKAPVLIMYGTGDGIVPNAQSLKMIQALRGAQKSVAAVTLPGEDHWLSRSETRTQVLRELESFLSQNLNPNLSGTN
jgi:dipeptidyl aminopeptidase/acylaminoacyl peptidase